VLLLLQLLLLLLLPMLCRCMFSTRRWILLRPCWWLLRLCMLPLSGVSLPGLVMSDLWHMLALVLRVCVSCRSAPILQ